VPHGLLCTCGAHGCLEMYCSGKALTLVAERLFDARELFAVGTRFAGAELLIERARAGHERAVGALREAFTYLGLGLTNLVNLLNPRLVILGGGIISAWPQGVQVSTDIVMQGARVEARRGLRIETSRLGNYAGVLGGAALVSARCSATSV
jgi:glucokinase